METPEAEFWAQQAENRKNPDFQMALKQSTETAEEERNERRRQLSVVPKGTAWKVLDLAKLEPPRRDGSRALNVAALLEDFRSLAKSKGLPFCIRFALEAALLKNEPLKDQVTCENVARAFSTKVVTTVAQNWNRRRRGQLESWHTAVALGDPLAALVGRLAEERKDTRSPDEALRLFSRATEAAMDDALRHRISNERALFSGGADTSAKARVQVPNLRARLDHDMQTGTVLSLIHI